MKTPTLIISVWLLFAVGYMQEHYRHQAELQAVKAKMAAVEAELNGARLALAKHNVLYASVSAYTASVDECDATPMITSTGARSRPGITAAVSRDLRHLIGKRVFIPGAGMRVIEDSMAGRWGNKVDIMVATRAAALDWGVRQKKIIILE